MIKLYSRYTLIKRIVQSRKLIRKLVAFPFSEVEIMPYKETCPGIKKAPNTEASADINAHDLFNHFTADVIKEKTVFVR